MKDYMLIYHGGDPAWMEHLTPEQIGGVMAAWGEWMEKLAEGGNLVNGGAPLHVGGKRLSSDGVITDIPASEFKELVSGYSIIKANSIEEALELAKSCPVFSDPAVVLEVREVQELS